MKNFFFGLFILFLGLSACSTDFQLEGEWSDIPVVYGFVSIQDTAHYIRVQRAFLEPGGNANEIGQLLELPSQRMLRRHKPLTDLACGTQEEMKQVD